MKNLKSIFQSLIIASTTAFSISVSQISYGEKVDLPCCKDETCPTRQEGPPGEMGVTQSATFVGVSVPLSHGGREVINVFGLDPTYRDWSRDVAKRTDLEKGDKLALIKAARTKPQVNAWCMPNEARAIPGSGGFVLTPGGASFSCENGKIVLSEDDLKCDDPATGPYSIVDITRDDRKKLKLELEALKAKHADLGRQREENARRVEQHKANIVALKRQIFDLQPGDQSSYGRNGNSMYDVEQSRENSLESEVGEVDFDMLGKGLVLPQGGLETLVSGSIF